MAATATTTQASSNCMPDGFTNPGCYTFATSTSIALQGCFSPIVWYLQKLCLHWTCQVSQCEMLPSKKTHLGGRHRALLHCAFVCFRSCKQIRTNLQHTPAHRNTRKTTQQQHQASKQRSRQKKKQRSRQKKKQRKGSFSTTSCSCLLLACLCGHSYRPTLFGFFENNEFSYKAIATCIAL